MKPASGRTVVSGAVTAGPSLIRAPLFRDTLSSPFAVPSPAVSILLLSNVGSAQCDLRIPNRSLSIVIEDAGLKNVWGLGVDLVDSMSSLLCGTVLPVLASIDFRERPQWSI